MPSALTLFGSAGRMMKERGPKTVHHEAWTRFRRPGIYWSAISTPLSTLRQLSARYTVSGFPHCITSIRLGRRPTSRKSFPLSPAWKTFVSYNTPSADVFKILEEQYREAIDRIREPAGGNKCGPDQDEHLARH